MTGASGTVGRDNGVNQGLATGLARGEGQAGEEAAGAGGVSGGEGTGERNFLGTGWARRGPKEKEVGECRAGAGA